jgi:2-keto-4-pentenoate hydratase/2-oxohepta-3-ene-1,7-dioic acid hydratase in catechol pathway
MIPKGADKVDWEVEFAIILGRRVNYVAKPEALDYVAGYALHNDYSERGFQKDRGGQWVKGKSCDTFAPLGPFLATPEEVPDPGNLKMWLKVNGVTLGMKTPEYLKPGDVVELGIDSLGESRQQVVAFSEALYATAR